MVSLDGYLDHGILPQLCHTIFFFCYTSWKRFGGENDTQEIWQFIWIVVSAIVSLSFKGEISLPNALQSGATSKSHSSYKKFFSSLLLPTKKKKITLNIILLYFTLQTITLTQQKTKI